MYMKLTKVKINTAYCIVKEELPFTKMKPLVLQSQNSGHQSDQMQGSKNPISRDPGKAKIRPGKVNSVSHLPVGKVKKN